MRHKDDYYDFSEQKDIKYNTKNMSSDYMDLYMNSLIAEDFRNNEEFLRFRACRVYLLKRLCRDSNKVLTVRQKQVLKLVLGFNNEVYIGQRKIKDIYKILKIREMSFYDIMSAIKRRLSKYFKGSSFKSKVSKRSTKCLKIQRIIKKK